MGRYFQIIAKFAILAGVAFGGVWVFQNQTQIADWWYLRDYQPPTRIVELSNRSTMTEEGRRIFYRTRPQIHASRDQLAIDCRIQDDKIIELGCYLSRNRAYFPDNRIYLLDIQQPELASEMVVTAAHEALHAAYDRMEDDEKLRINTELKAAAAKIPDSDFRERMEQYNRLEPGEHENELHSIIGTEYSDLSPALEAHYARYFSDRDQLVGYSKSFKRTFDGLREEYEVLDARIKSMRNIMDGHLARGEISAYNRLVPVVNRDINSYNQKVELYNRYASALLGREAPIQSQPSR